MGLPRARAADQHDIALAGEEGAGREITDQALVDRRAGELEARNLLGERQLRRRHLILDRARVLIGDLRRQQLADDVLVGVLALDLISDHLVIGVAHAGELEFAHQVEDLMAFQHHAARQIGNRRS